jgi:hypothetical protein
MRNLSLILVMLVLAGFSPLVGQDAMLADTRGPICLGVKAEMTEITEGDRIWVEADAVEPNGKALECEWVTTGGRVEGTETTATYDSSGVKPGEYVITARIDDGFGNKVECSITVTVRAVPYIPPRWGTS